MEKITFEMGGKFVYNKIQGEQRLDGRKTDTDGCLFFYLLWKCQEGLDMHEYEIFIEDINPCGGEKYSKKTLIEAEAESPEAYVKENGRFPILETTSDKNGDVVIVTGDNRGSFVRYTFTE